MHFTTSIINFSNLELLLKIHPETQVSFDFLILLVMHALQI